MTQLILYTSEDGKSQIQLRADGQTVWLTQMEMAELFNATKQNISLHLKNVFADGELDPAATVKESLTVQTEGSRPVSRSLTLYNLDAILAVGYRVRSPRGVQFRRWASTVLKEYLLKGFAMDDERLKNPDGRPDYFDEMLARANAADPHFGLLTWKGAQVRKQDIVVAKNYLTEDEIDTLNRLVVIFLETAELRAKRQTVTPMAFWQENVGQIITANGFPLLSGAGSVSHARMEQQVGTLFLDYDQRRKTLEAQAADAQDEVELKALESKIKHRTGKPS